MYQSFLFLMFGLVFSNSLHAQSSYIQLHPDSTSFTECEAYAVERFALYAALGGWELRIHAYPKDHLNRLSYTYYAFWVVGGAGSLRLHDCTYTMVDGNSLNSPIRETSEKSGIKTIAPVCGSIIDVAKKTVSESVPIDGTELQFVYSSEFNPKRDLNRGVKENLNYSVLRSDRAVNVVSGDGQTGLGQIAIPNLESSSFSWIWDETAGNLSLHPALKKTDIALYGGFKFPSNSYNQIWYPQDVDRGYLPADHYSWVEEFFAIRKILVYHPEVWGLRGWTLSNHHYFDRDTRTLFHGSGKKIEDLVYKTITLGTYGDVDLVSSHYDDEIYIFDQLGQHLETRTKLLNAVKYKFNYDTSKKLISLVDIHNKTTTFAYDSNGLISKITAPYGQETLFTVNTQGQISVIKNSILQTYDMVYDSKNFLTKFTKPDLQVTDFVYNNKGDFVEEIKNVGSDQSFTAIYENLKQTFSKITNLGISAIFEVVKDSRISTETKYKDGNGDLISTTQTSLNNTVTLKNNNEISYTKKTDPMWGSYLDENPEQILYSESGQNINIIHYLENVYTYADPENPLTLQSFKATLAYANRPDKTEVRFDVATKTFTLIDPQGRISKIILNAKEQISRYEPAVGAAKDFTYNTNGQLTSVSQGTQYENYLYDGHGFVQSITNSKSQVTSFLRNSQGQVTQKTLPNLETILFEYTNGGEIKKITTPSNKEHTFQFLLGDFVSGYLSPITGGQTTYAYDANQRLTTVTKPSGRVTTYSYKAGTEYVNQIATPEGNYSFSTIDPQGRVRVMSSPDGIKTEVDWTGEKIQQQKWYDADNTLIGSVSFDYQLNSFRVQSVYINNLYLHDYNYGLQFVNYIHILGRPFFFHYEKNLQTSEQIRVESYGLEMIYENQTYENGNKSQHIVKASMNEGWTTPLEVTMTRKFDNFGQALEYSSTVMNTNQNSLHSFYQLIPAYDENDRLIQVQRNTGILSNGVVTPVTEFFDQYIFPTGSNGNISSYIRRPTLTAAPTSSTTATYGVDDRIVSLSGTMARTYTHDADGNLATITDPNGVTTYTYDDFSNLKQISYPNGKVIQYKVDAQNRRVKKLVNGTVTEYYLWYDQLRLAAVLDENKNVKYSYIYTPESRTPSFMIKDGFSYRIIHDPGLGSIRYVFKINSYEVIQELEYDQFGNVIKNSNPGFQSLGYAGGLMDADSEFIRFGARDYDPVVGRWTTKDPIGFNGGDTNLYAYVGGNPMSYVDPTGLYWFRQWWQEPGQVGRVGSIVPPAPKGQISDFIESYVPAGYTFGQNHDRFVDWGRDLGAPDLLVNIPSMISLYYYSFGQEALRSVNIISQPTPPEGQMCK